MSVATTTRRSPSSKSTTLTLVTLRESAQSATFEQVDRQAGLIRGVKVLGRISPNKHKIPGAEKGTEYTTEAMQAAIPLYEGAPVYKNHPPRTHVDVVRPISEEFGWLTNPVLRDAGIYADLHLFTSDPDAQKILEAAEKNPRAFALSHNADGRFEVRNGKAYIVEIPEVRSVDIVTRGGTVSSLFESKEPPIATKKLRALFESLGPKAKRKAAQKQVKHLLEVDGLVTDDMAMEEPAADASPEDALLAGFKAAMNAILDDDTLDASAKQKKIGEYLKAHEKLTAEPATADEGETTTEEADDEGETETPESEECVTGKKPMKESRKPRKPSKDPAVVQLQEQLAEMKSKNDRAELREFIHTECKKRELPEETALLEGLETMNDRPKIVKFLDHLKTQVKPAVKGPRSQGPTRPLYESREAATAPAKDSKEFVSRITG